MKEFNTDVLIVGSGLVGLVAAHCLSSLNYKVTLVDKKNLISSQNSFKDTRTVAVSEGSKIFLESLSLWSYLERYAEPIKNINVYDRSSHNKILFSNQIKNKKLGYVIENKQFSKILINQLKKFKNTKLQYGFNLVNAELNDKNTRVQLAQCMRELRFGRHAVAVQSLGMGPLEAILSGPAGEWNAEFFGWPKPYPDVSNLDSARDEIEGLTDQLHAPDFDCLNDDERAEVRDLSKAARAHATERAEAANI